MLDELTEMRETTLEQAIREESASWQLQNQPEQTAEVEK
jgi:hypothetical protein